MEIIFTSSVPVDYILAGWIFDCFYKLLVSGMALTFPLQFHKMRTRQNLLASAQRQQTFTHFCQKGNEVVKLGGAFFKIEKCATS